MPTQPPPIDPRTYPDLVAQLETLAEAYTMHQWRSGQGDAGAALIRIFGRMAATLVEQLNQVPEKSFLAFLDLIGTQMLPPRPARVPITFQLAAGSKEAALGAVPAGTRVAAKPSPGEKDDVIFETDKPLMLTTARLMSDIVRDRERPPARYFGFDRAFANRAVTLYCQVASPLYLGGTDDGSSVRKTTRLLWEYSAPQGWQPLKVEDDTAALTTSGLVSFVGPANFASRKELGADRFWLRAQWQAQDIGGPVSLIQMRTNTVWATQASTTRDEILGSSTSEPNQVFKLARAPVLAGAQIDVRERELPSPTERMQLEAMHGAAAVTPLLDLKGQLTGVWVRWQRVSDFYGSGPHDRHFVLDDLTGEVRFGDGRYGAIPPQGRANIRTTAYRTGGGSRGNLPAGAITQLKTTIPYVRSASNAEPATGGAERESFERVKARGPQVLRHRGLAVTAQDFEDLALLASQDVARAMAIFPRGDDAENAGALVGKVQLILVPRSDDAQPIPSLALLGLVKDYVQARCSPTLDVTMAGPGWVRVAVTAKVTPASLEAANTLADAVRDALTRFLHPLTGGFEGDGWPFGRKPHLSDLYALIESISGVDHVHELRVSEEPPFDGLPAAQRARTSIYSSPGEHEVSLI